MGNKNETAGQPLRGVEVPQGTLFCGDNSFSKMCEKSNNEKFR